MPPHSSPKIPLKACSWPLLVSLRAPFSVKIWWIERRFTSFYSSRLLSNRKIYRPIFLHLAPKRQWLKHHFAPFRMLFQSVEALFRLFCTLHILAMDLLFAAFYPAFCYILPCVLLHFALRFGAKWSVFCRILPCVLVHFTPYFAAKGVVWRTKCIFKQRQAVVYPPLYAPCFAPNKLAQYSQNCGRAEDWLEKSQP